MPKLRADQYFALILLTCVWLVFPTHTRANIPPVITEKVYEPLPVLNFGFSYPTKKVQTAPDPYITAKAAIIYDPLEGAILYEKSDIQELPQASLTKLMTAIVTIENYKLDDVVTVQHGEEKTEGNVMYLKAGEHITVGNLLKGLLIYSSNDAALALANHHPQGYDAFISLMNQKAAQLHLAQTQFKNPVGFDDEAHYSTAYDLAILSKEILSHPELSQIMQTDEASVTNVEGNISHEFKTTNLLLHKLSGVIAGKTGSTPLAGECLVAEVVRNDHPLITVVLGSQDRFTDTTNLVEWAYTYYDWQNPSDPLINSQPIR